MSRSVGEVGGGAGGKKFEVEERAAKAEI